MLRFQFEDPHSGIVRYMYRVCPMYTLRSSCDGVDNDCDGAIAACSQPCTPATCPEVPLGNNSVATVTAVGRWHLRHNGMYFVEAWAENGVGVLASVRSAGWTIDTTEPTVSTTVSVRDNPSVFSQHWRSATALWVGVFHDQESGIARYEMCVGSSPLGDDLLPCTSLGLVEQGSLPLPPETADVAKARGLSGYFTTIVAVNKAGGRASASSEGVTVDTTPPVAGSVFVDRFVAGTSELTVRWSNFRENETEILGYWLDWGTSPGSRDVVGTIVLGLVNEHTVRSLTLSHGSQYYATVMAYNSAIGWVGNSSTAVTVAAYGPDPTGVVIHVGNGTVSSTIHTSTQLLQASWTAFSGPATLPVVRYLVGVCREAVPECDDSEFVDVGKVLSFKRSGLNLQDGASYTVRVRAYNEVGCFVSCLLGHVLCLTRTHTHLQAGLFTEVVSQAFIVDATPPTSGSVYHGAGRVHKPWLSTLSSPLTISWSNIIDRESGLSTLRYSIGNTTQHADLHCLL